MKLTASSPCRVDLAGGTVDIWPLYLYHGGAVTVNFAVNLYTRCTIETSPGPGILLRSIDQKAEETFPSLDALVTAGKYRLPLSAWILRFFRPATGLTVETLSEAPAGAGISGSSSLMITLGSAMNRLNGCGFSRERIREICQSIESQIIRVPTGCQDYYPALYGGLSAIEMDPAGVRRSAIAADLEEFNSRVVVVYTGKPRNSGINNWAVMKEHINGNRKVHRNFDRIVAIARLMRAALERSDWSEAARLLRDEWEHRKRNFPGISTPLIDRLVQVTRRHGARGAKVCGAGGGGCMVLLVEPDAKARISQVIAAEGARVLPVAVSPRGVNVAVSH